MKLESCDSSFVKEVPRNEAEDLTEIKTKPHELGKRNSTGLHHVCDWNAQLGLPSCQSGF